MWRKPWDVGWVFSVSWGHQASDFDVAPARVIVERGILWAAGRNPADVSA